jgi:hypothetical protein
MADQVEESEVVREWRARLEAVQTDTQSEAAVAAAYRLLRDARKVADMAAWFHAEFRGYPIARGAKAAHVARPTFYRDIERHEASALIGAGHDEDNSDG